MLLTLRQQIAQELAETETLLSSRLDEILNEKQRDRDGNADGADLSGNGVINTVRKGSGLSRQVAARLQNERQKRQTGKP